DAVIGDRGEAEPCDEGPCLREPLPLHLLRRDGLEPVQCAQDLVVELWVGLFAPGPECELRHECGSAEAMQVPAEPLPRSDQVETAQRVQVSSILEIEGGAPGGEGF